MESTTHRRWFRFAFSLRTLFVIVTIFGVWLGWNLKIVRERKAVLAELRLAYTASRNLKCISIESNECKVPGSMSSGYDYARVSVVRRLLGDESFIHIDLPQDLLVDPRFIERVEHAFPEARLVMVVRGIAFTPTVESRDSLYKPADQRMPNSGRLFKTGLTEK